MIHININMYPTAPPFPEIVGHFNFTEWAGIEGSRQSGSRKCSVPAPGGLSKQKPGYKRDFGNSMPQQVHACNVFGSNFEILEVGVFERSQVERRGPHIKCYFQKLMKDSHYFVGDRTFERVWHCILVHLLSCLRPLKRRVRLASSQLLPDAETHIIQGGQFCIIIRSSYLPAMHCPRMDKHRGARTFSTSCTINCCL